MVDKRKLNILSYFTHQEMGPMPSLLNVGELFDGFVLQYMTEMTFGKFLCPFIKRLASPISVSWDIHSYRAKTQYKNWNKHKAGYSAWHQETQIAYRNAEGAQKDSQLVSYCFRLQLFDAF